MVYLQPLEEVVPDDDDLLVPVQPPLARVEALDHRGRGVDAGEQLVGESDCIKEYWVALEEKNSDICVCVGSPA